jgi:glycosyltransferase involved in cell wall biosynthesis
VSEHDLIAIVWAPHESRTAMFAKRLNAPLFNVHYLQYKRPLIAPFKYVAQWLKTWQILFQNRPRIVYVTNPPVFAVFCVFVYCRLMGASYIMDTHPPALYSRKWGWTVPLQRFLARFAFVNVVDQERFKILFESWGAKALVLENPPKAAPDQRPQDLPDAEHFDIAVINTFAADEPLDVVIEAARRLPDVRFYVLGDTALAKPSLLSSAPENVVFTGYLLGDAYWNQLYAARAILVQTTYPYSLLGGAHDAMMIGKPLILSRQPALTEYFTRGAVFVDNTADSVTDGILAAQTNERQLAWEITELSEEQGQRWELNFQKLLDLIRSPGSQYSPSRQYGTN